MTKVDFCQVCRFSKDSGNYANHWYVCQRHPVYFEDTGELKGYKKAIDVRKELKKDKVYTCPGYEYDKMKDL